jgi:hypothetical protein
MIHTEHNPGKYDDVCTEARMKTGALGAALIIIGGGKGTGFSVQAPPGVLAALPGLLEDMAAEIRRDLNSLMP